MHHLMKFPEWPARYAKPRIVKRPLGGWVCGSSWEDIRGGATPREAYAEWRSREMLG